MHESRGGEIDKRGEEEKKKRQIAVHARRADAGIFGE